MIKNEKVEMENKHLSEKEKQFLEAVKRDDLPEVKQVVGEINVNCEEEDGMTALMFACYKGNTNMVEYLIENGASASSNSHKEGYTPLMFATLAGSTEVVRLLLEAGAKIDVRNKVNRTASQIGAFVGRHDCVTLINNFVEQDNVKYYTKKHGLQEQPKLKEHIAGTLHKYMVIPNLNPVKLIFFIQNHKELLLNHKSVYDVMEAECEKAFKGVNEILALKLHFHCCVLKKAVAWENGDEGKGGLEGLLKFLAKGRPEDGCLVGIEHLLRNSIKLFPYSQSNIFQQLVKVLSKVPIGNDPSAISAITQLLNGIQSADFSECCVCCGERESTNKCSVCKVVRYCDTRCQKLHWTTHKKFCKELRKTQEVMQNQKTKEVHESRVDGEQLDLNNLNVNEEDKSNSLVGNDNIEDHVQD